MLGSRRLFIGIPIPKDVVNQTTTSETSITDLIREFGAMGKFIRPVSTQNLHLTSRFIGNVDSNLVSKVARATQEVADATSNFRLTLRGLGGFPNSNRPTVVWAGVDPREPCIKLAESLNKSLEPLGFEREKRSYKPHLTLARIKGQCPREITNGIRAFRDVEFAVLPVDEIVLYESTLTPEGPVYTRVNSSNLSAV